MANYGTWLSSGVPRMAKYGSLGLWAITCPAGRPDVQGRETRHAPKKIVEIAFTLGVNKSLNFMFFRFFEFSKFDRI